MARNVREEVRRLFELERGRSDGSIRRARGPRIDYQKSRPVVAFVGFIRNDKTVCEIVQLKMLVIVMSILFRILFVQLESLFFRL